MVRSSIRAEEVGINSGIFCIDFWQIKAYCRSIRSLRTSEMPLLSISELQIILEPHVATFSRIVWPVLEDYEEHIPLPIRLQFGVITQANVLHAFMANNARREFNGQTGVSVIEGPNESVYISIDGLGLGVDGTAVCQFKKLDNDNRSRNFQTARQRMIRENEYVLGISESATFVDAGYVLNDLGTAIRTVPLVRLFDQETIFELPRQLGGTVSMLPAGPRPLPGVADRFTIFRPKKKKDSQGDDGSGN